jgi:hypothetical protein
MKKDIYLIDDIKYRVRRDYGHFVSLIEHEPEFYLPRVMLKNKSKLNECKVNVNS